MLPVWQSELPQHDDITLIVATNRIGSADNGVQRRERLLCIMDQPDHIAARLRSRGPGIVKPPRAVRDTLARPCSAISKAISGIFFRALAAISIFPPFTASGNRKLFRYASFLFNTPARRIQKGQKLKFYSENRRQIVSESIAVVDKSHNRKVEIGHRNRPPGNELINGILSGHCDSGERKPFTSSMSIVVEKGILL
jgi:hypothetical protein